VTYATLMVQLELGHSNAAILQVTGELAEQFHASVIGIAACQPLQVYGDVYFPADLIEQDRAELEKQINAAEAEFRTALHARAEKIAWRATITLGSLADYLANEARSADLVITGADRKRPLFDSTRQVSPGDLVMQIGRPLLIIPTAETTFKFDHVLVAWKETREARRAILDALPFLKKAAHVTVIEIANEDELPAARLHLEDVAGWLKHHRVTAEIIASVSTGNDPARLQTMAREQNADLIVAGAYGHSRLRELVLGGVTKDLLLRSGRCSFLSH
jgi:nucleotide-binding universal stress UspA family protein